MDVVDSVAVEAVIVEDAVDSAVVEVVTVEDVEDSADVAVVTVDAEDVVVTADVAHQEDVVEPEPREEQRPLSSHIATLVSLLPAERRICW